METFRIAFWAVAVAWSLFYGLFAWDIHVWKWRSERSRAYDLRWQHRVHQNLFNTAGSLAGWAALWALKPACLWDYSCSINVTWGSAALAFVAFAGVTGHIPFAFAQVLGSVVTIAALLAEWIKRGLERLIPQAPK